MKSTVLHPMFCQPYSVGNDDDDDDTFKCSQKVNINIKKCEIRYCLLKWP